MRGEATDITHHYTLRCSSRPSTRRSSHAAFEISLTTSTSLRTRYQQTGLDGIPRAPNGDTLGASGALSVRWDGWRTRNGVLRTVDCFAAPDDPLPAPEPAPVGTPSSFPSNAAVARVRGRPSNAADVRVVVGGFRLLQTAGVASEDGAARSCS